MKHVILQMADKDELSAVPKRFAARDRRTLLYGLSALIDLICLYLGYVFALQVRDERWLEAGGQSILILAVPIFVMISMAREVQSLETLESRLLAIKRALGSLAATALAVLAIGFLVAADQISRLGFALAFGMSGLLMVLGKILMDALFKALLGGQALRSIALCDGVDSDCDSGVDSFDLGEFDIWPDPDRPEMMDQISRMVAPYDRIIVYCEASRRQTWAAFLKGLDVGGEIVLGDEGLLGAVGIGHHHGKDTLVMSLGPLNLVNRIQKRVFDLAAASIILLALSPVLLVTALAIKLESPGPVLFRQRRVGLGSRQFEILKFRSMHFDACDTNGSQSAARDDERITRVGRFIRRTSLDEVPQLINVLQGEMSMVGPRPHALGSRAGESLFWQASNYYWMRHALKPGLTGLAQIRGLRGATETERDIQKRVRADLEYLSSWSLWTDFLILLKTVRVLVHEKAF